MSVNWFLTIPSESKEPCDASGRCRRKQPAFARLSGSLRLGIEREGLRLHNQTLIYAVNNRVQVRKGIEMAHYAAFVIDDKGFPWGPDCRGSPT